MRPIGVKANSHDGLEGSAHGWWTRWESFEERLKFLVSLAGPGDENGRLAARLAGLAETTLNKMMAGTRKPSHRVLVQLRHATGVNLNWLLCNQGYPGDAENVLPAWRSASAAMKAATTPASARAKASRAAGAKRGA